MNALQRFARQLVESLGAHEPGALAAPVPLDELTRRILPYRACRRLLDIVNVEDYELLVLRLAAGEGGLAVAVPMAAAERCRAALDTGDPDLGVLRELEGVTLRLNLGAIAFADVVEDDGSGAIVRSYTLYEPAPAPEGEPEAAAEPEQPDAPVPSGEVPEAAGAPVEFDSVDAAVAPVEEDPPAPAPAPAETEETSASDPFQELFDAAGDGPDPEPELAQPEEPPLPPPSSEPVAPPPPATYGEPPPRCPHCASSLPAGRPVRFCPHCGGNVVPMRCGRCGGDLEPSWRHCVLCGAPAFNDSRFA